MDKIQDIVEKKVDRRVIKTKKAIRSAFAELLSYKNIDDITIKDIADKADVNRKTVYNYYGGIHDILDEIENEIVLSCESVIKEIGMINGIENTYHIFESLTKVINSNLDFYGKLLKINANNQLIRKIIGSLMKMANSEFRSQKLFDEDKIDLITCYIVSGMVASYQAWFNSGRKQSIEDFSKDVASLVLNGVGQYINS